MVQETRSQNSHAWATLRERINKKTEAERPLDVSKFDNTATGASQLEAVRTIFKKPRTLRAAEIICAFVQL